MLKMGNDGFNVWPMLPSCLANSARADRFNPIGFFGQSASGAPKARLIELRDISVLTIESARRFIKNLGQ